VGLTDPEPLTYGYITSGPLNGTFVVDEKGELWIRPGGGFKADLNQDIISKFGLILVWNPFI